MTVIPRTLEFKITNAVLKSLPSSINGAPTIITSFLSRVLLIILPRDFLVSSRSVSWKNKSW